MNRDFVLKGLAVSSIFLCFVPAVAYYIVCWKSLSNNSNVISLRELAALGASTGIATLAHAGVSFVQQSTGLGSGF